MTKDNHVGIHMGFPGSGKSALLKEHAAQKLDAGAFAFVQDPDRQFADVLPCYDSPGAWAQAQAQLQSEGKPIQRGASIATTDEGALTAFVLKLAAQLSETGGPPVFVGYDEAVLLSQASAHHVGEDLLNILARRRHLGIMAEILTQDLGQVHAIWQRLASDLFLFRNTDRTRLKTISERFGVPVKQLEARMHVMKDRYDYLHLQHGRIVGRTILNV